MKNELTELIPHLIFICVLLFLNRIDTQAGLTIILLLVLIYSAMHEYNFLEVSVWLRKLNTIYPNLYFEIRFFSLTISS